MSWSLNYKSAEEFRNDQPENPITPNSVIDTMEHREQIKVAKEAAMDLLESHACGLKDVTILLSGHANPEHKPVNTLSNDFITVQIIQKS